MNDRSDAYVMKRWAPLYRLAEAFSLNFTPQQLASLAADADNMTAAGIDSDAWHLVAAAIDMARVVEVDRLAVTAAMRRLDAGEEQ